ncbi:MAG: hypothetical protein LBV73_16495 [Paraburkholderia sp.]|nr:hypothetical protein [Paraburkholderia sp.]
MDKNIGCYRRYIGPISLLTANADPVDFSGCFAALRQGRRLAGHPRGLDLGPIFAVFCAFPATLLERRFHEAEI